MNSTFLSIINNIYCHHIITDIGKRDYNEDRYFIYRTDMIQYYAILDGHGGIYVAEYVKLLLQQYFNSKELNNYFQNEHLKNRVEVQQNLQTMIKDMYNSITKKVQEKYLKKSNSGTTLTALLKFQLKDGSQIIILSNIGDSMIYKLSKRKGMIELINQHKIGPKQENYIKKKNGFVIDGRVGGSLAMAKSIGDLDVQKYLPQGIDTYVLKEQQTDQYFLLCSDGLSDIIQSQPKLSEQCNNTVKEILLNQNKDQQDKGFKCKALNETIFNIVKNHIDDNYTSIVIK